MLPNQKTLFDGCATALITPMKQHDIDKDAYERLLLTQIEAGVDALVITGTTGESATLTDREKEYLYKKAVALSHTYKPKVPIIAGTGSNNTARAVELSRMAEAAGVDGLLVVTPYYNKTSQEGLIAHYTAIAEAVHIPLIMYHVPSRTGCNLTVETCRILSHHPRIAGLKDATGNMGFTARVAAVCGGALPIYCGNDDMVLPTLSLGGRGVISVVSNLLPVKMTQLCKAFFEGDLSRAAIIQKDILPLCDVLFAEVNPIPVKCAMKLCGMCGDEVRLPLCSANDTLRLRIKEILSMYGFEIQ